MRPRYTLVIDYGTKKKQNEKAAQLLYQFQREVELLHYYSTFLTDVDISGIDQNSAPRTTENTALSIDRHTNRLHSIYALVNGLPV